MKQLKIFTVIGSIFVLLAGSLAHFLYEWSGCSRIVGLFVPVNESIWEHMKLVFFPMLLYTLFMLFQYRADYPCIASSFCCGILTGTLLIPLLFYAYTYLLGRDIFLMDIGIFILSILAAFWTAYRLTLSCKAKPYALLLGTLVCLFILCFAVFTYRPPKLKLFEDPEASACLYFYIRQSSRSFLP